MNPRILHASKASRGVPAPGANYRRAPRVHRVNRHSSFVIAPRGLTLVEMLIGMAITLLMMAAIVNLFANISSGVRIRRATMEMGGQLRIMRATLFNDLAGATCRTLPWQRPDEDPGYLEIVEGEYSDKRPTGLALDPALSQVPGSQITPAGQLTDGMGLGDFDDILALTVRSELSPFRGRSYDPNANQMENIESNLAEIVWFAVENPADGSLGEPGMRTVYRRVMLIAPWVEPIDLTAYSTTGAPLVADDSNAFYQRYDISARFDTATSKWIPNTLGDLTKRENRFAHNLTLFPHLIDQTHIRFLATPTGPLHPYGEPWITLDIARGDPDRQGEDVMLNDVLAFDVRVFDPGAPLFQFQNVIVEPASDSVFTTANAVKPSNLVGFGTFVDLGWDESGDYDPNDPSYATLFPNIPDTLFQQERQVGWHPNAPIGGTPAVYDTWSFHYEHDGLNQDGDTLTDEGTNGLDDNNQDGVDDILERETSPPYPVPLRGMQVKIRIYDPGTRQIREATVTRNFVPQ